MDFFAWTRRTDYLSQSRLAGAAAFGPRRGASAPVLQAVRGLLVRPVADLRHLDLALVPARRSGPFTDSRTLALWYVSKKKNGKTA